MTNVIEPAGWKLLLEVEPVAEKVKSILIPDEARDRMQRAVVMAKVIACGKEAYSNKERYPSGPWCVVGDCVLIEKWGGSRYKINGKDLRIVNDDEIIGIVADPAAIHIEN